MSACSAQRCAVAFTCDMDAGSILHLAHHTAADTQVAALSMLRYGPEVAVPRLIDLYAKVRHASDLSDFSYT